MKGVPPSWPAPAGMRPSSPARTPGSGRGRCRGSRPTRPATATHVSIGDCRYTTEASTLRRRLPTSCSSATPHIPAKTMHGLKHVSGQPLRRHRPSLQTHQGAAEQVALQQRVLHQRQRQQKRREAARDERHKLADMGDSRRRELGHVELRCLLAGIQPAHGREKSGEGRCTIGQWCTTSHAADKALSNSGLARCCNIEPHKRGSAP